MVASGCTDNTEGIVCEFCERDSRVRLLTQKSREGKASAVNLFLQQATQDVLVLCSADVLPADGTIEKLVEPFSDPEVGMTGARQIPVDDPSTFMGFAVHLQWYLHHEVSLRRPKMGELVAFRKALRRIPRWTAVDEASVESVIAGQGYKLVYVPDAILYNKGAETMGDFLSQRRHYYAGHLSVRKHLGYKVSTMGGLKLLPLVLANLKLDPKVIVWTFAVILLEVYGRFLGWRDFRFGKRDHVIWERRATTKEVAE